KRFERCSIRLLETVQEILRAKPSRAVFIQVLVHGQGDQQVFMALSGILKTAHLEHPKLRGQMIALSEPDTAQGLIAKLKESRLYPEDQDIRYAGERRLVATFEELSNPRSEAGLPWKNNGVYLIVGGAGGLGLIFAKEIAEQANNTTLILTGRSEAGPALRD